MQTARKSDALRPGEPRAAPLDAPRGGKYERRYWEVIDAVAAEFAERGYHGTSTKAIAERLMVRQGSLYYYFSSKEAALEEVCYRGVEDFLQNLERVAADPCDSAEKVRRIVRNHLRPFLERPNYVRVFLNQRQLLPRESRRKIGALIRDYEALVARIVADGIEAGAFRADLDPRIAALGIIGLSNSAVAWLGIRMPLSQLDTVADAFADLLLGGMARPNVATGMPS